ncbi:MMPL family transporter [Fructilactobacillus sp. Tb1]|uniref:MMPL family transporter n=1 Tax=Fructilactobacillus sp. Tb1 TaxID=3422304 RepID=UPI003D2C2CB6
MSKFKALINHHWIISFIISGIIATIALVTLPNLSGIAFQAITPPNQLTKNAQQITKHWGNNQSDALPVSITYQVPTEFSDSQKIRLATKERWLIEHKRDLQIYKITSANTSPHAKNQFQGKNWLTLQFWIPANLINSPDYQTKLRHFSSLAGIKSNWNNPSNEAYQKITNQWFKQKIACVWVLIINFILLLVMTNFTKSLLLSLFNLELDLIILNLSTHFSINFFYTPLAIVLATSVIISACTIRHHIPNWLKKCHNPMQNWHPLITIFLLICLIFPLFSNCQIQLQEPQKKQTVTLYLANQQSLISNKNLSIINNLTNEIKRLPNVSQVTSVTQPGGYNISKYQLKTILGETITKLEQQQNQLQSSTTEIKNLTDEPQIATNLHDQATQLNQIKDQEKLKQSLQNANHDLDDQFKSHTEHLTQIQNKLTETNPDDELYSLTELNQQLGKHFFLTKQDAVDSDFNQTCYNYNNHSQTATRINITLRDGQLHNLPTQIKNKLAGTPLANVKIGMTGVAINEANQRYQFQQRFPIYLIGMGLILLLFISFRFKSLSLGIIILMAIIISLSASLGMLAYLTTYQFTLSSIYLLGYLYLIASLITLTCSAKLTMLTSPLVIIPLLLVASLQPLGLAVVTFMLIFQFLFPVILQANKKRLLFRSLLPKHLLGINL